MAVLGFSQGDDLFEEPEEMSSQTVMASVVTESQCAWRLGWFRKGALG